MRVNDVGSSLGFGGLVAIGLFCLERLLGPWPVSASVEAAYLAGCLVVYCGLLGSTRRHMMRNALVGLFGAAIVVMISDGMGGIFVGFTCVLGFVRSGLEFRRGPLRGLILESVIGGAGLVFAAWLAMPGGLGDSIALWGFMLVEGLYFLIGEAPSKEGLRRGRGGSCGRDPFERADRELSGLLDGFES